MNKKKTRNSTGPGSGGGAGSSRPMARGATNKEPSGIRAANRQVSGSPTRNSGPAVNADQESGDKEGIFSNIRLTHACTCLIGAPVIVKTTDGSTFDGLFRVFSPNLEITLEQAHLIDPNDPTKIDPDKVKANIVFPFHEVVSVTACDVDLEYAAKDGFKTDTQISGKHNGDGAAVRELERWEPEDMDLANDGGLGETNANGWSAEEMFKRNEEEYGVQSTFKDNLEGYTVQLDSVKNTDEYREREARAKQLAREMEGNSTAVELENGDEEEAFSAVQRGPSNRSDEGGSGKYVTPARRQSSGGPPGSGGKPQHINTGNARQPPQRSTPPPHDRDRRNDMRGNQRLSSERDYHHQGGHHSGRDQHSSHDDYGRGGASMHDNRRDMQSNRRSGGGNYGMKGEHTSGPPQNMAQRGPPMGGMHRQGQKSQSDQVSDLRDFRDNFHLATSNQGPPPQSGDRNYQQYQGGKHHSPKGHHHGDVNRSASRSPPSALPPSNSSKASSPPTPGVQEQKRFSPPTTATAAHIPVASINHKQEQEVSAPPTPAVAASVPAEVSGPPSTSSTPSSTTASIAKKSSLNPNAGEFVFNPKPAASVRPPSASPHQQQRPVTPATSHPGVPSPAIQPMPYSPQFAPPVYMAGPFGQQGIVHNAGPGGSPYPQGFPGSTAAPQIASPLQQQQHMGQQAQVGFQRGPGNGGPGNGNIQGGRQAPIQGANEAAAANIAAATGQPLVAPAPNPSPMVSQANNEQSQQHNIANFAGHYVVTPQLMAANHLVRLPTGVMIPQGGVNPLTQVQPNSSSGVGPIPPHVQENSGSVSLPPMANQGPGVPWIPSNPSGQPNIPPPNTGQPPPNPANSAPPQGPPPQHPGQGPQPNASGGPPPQPGSGGGNGNTPAQSPGPMLMQHPQQPMFSNSPAAAGYPMHLVPFHNPAAPGQIHPQHTIITSQAAGQHQQPITSIAGQIPGTMYHHYAIPQQHGPAQGMIGQHNSPFLIQHINMQQQQAAAVQQQQPPPQWGANFEDQTQPSTSPFPPTPPLSSENPSPLPPSSEVADDKKEATDVEVERERPQTSETPSSNNAATQNSFTATNSDSSCKITSLPEESSENSANFAAATAVMQQQFISPSAAFYSAPQQCFTPFPIHPVAFGQIYSAVPTGGGFYTPLATINGQFPPPQLPHCSGPADNRTAQEDVDAMTSPTNKKYHQEGKRQQTDIAQSVAPHQGGRVSSPPHKQQRRFLSGPAAVPPPGLLPHPPRSPYSPLVSSPRGLWPPREDRNFQGPPGLKNQGSKSAGSYGGGNRYERGERSNGKIRNFNSNQQSGYQGMGGRKTNEGSSAPLNVLSIPSAHTSGAGNLPIHSPRKSKGRT